MRNIGYARVSSQGQSLDRQVSALRAAGCDLIFREKASGKTTKGRPELEKAIDALGTGDCLVLAEWDRATRSLLDGIALMVRIHERKALIKALDRAAIDLTDPIGQGVFALLSGIAQAERQRIVKRANEGRAVARAKGVRFGRKPSSPIFSGTRPSSAWPPGESCRSVARAMNVHHATVARLVASDRRREA
jgi:DNA invertase Pin-like site-specific DNA recombinase